MKNLMKHGGNGNGHGLPMVPDEMIVSAYREACEAEADYALKAVVVGLLLLEKREYLKTHSGMTSHSGKSSGWHDRTKPDDEQFGVWLEAMGISKSRGYRWMEAADRVARHQLGLPVGTELPVAIDAEGTVMPLSQALTAPEEDLAGRALEFRQGMFEFMGDKTLSEAVRCACDGDSAASRITRAAVGKSAGGTKGENRKDWPLFVLRKLRDVGSHLEHWESMDAHQRNEVLTVFSGAVLGEYVSLHGRPAGKAKLGAWPSEVCEALLGVIRKRVKG